MGSLLDRIEFYFPPNGDLAAILSSMTLTSCQELLVQLTKLLNAVVQSLDHLKSIAQSFSDYLSMKSVSIEKGLQQALLFASTCHSELH